MYKPFLILATVFILVLVSCKENVLPKPKAYLSLSYPKKNYLELPLNRPYTFQIASNAYAVKQPNNWIKIKYPALKASLDITYRPVQNNLNELLLEAEKLVFKHTLKAAQIISKDFGNPKDKVFGTIYEITGNAASQVQFHATDSVHNFLKGSLYFYAKPNYDSILPAVEYIKEDVFHLMESLAWK